LIASDGFVNGDVIDYVVRSVKTALKSIRTRSNGGPFLTAKIKIFGEDKIFTCITYPAVNPCSQKRKLSSGTYTVRIGCTAVTAAKVAGRSTVPPVWSIKLGLLNGRTGSCITGADNKEGE
jgi:hypothetical protein